ncbi:MAG: diaminopimelate decarboxylase [Alphaproteobacteria bacterium]|nr:diaminopimelate decarboxylase [Alphaproteobacteria bacterium]
MHHFHYADGILHAESVALPAIAEAVGTPFYCYSTATLNRHVDVLSKAFAGTDHLICYAVKANSNQAVLKIVAAHGTGMDVVSEGELRRARAAGVPADKIIFAGVGKTRDEMAYAVSEDILGFNVESAAELHALSAVAAGLGKTARIAIRVNPDVDAKTHAKISTGKSDNKFGVPYNDAPALYDAAAGLPGIEVTGIHMHIGSQITDLEPFRKAFALLRDLSIDLRARGHSLKHLDLGGGLGVPYRGTNDIPPHPDEYAAVVRAALGELGLKLVLEPGRMITANAGILVSRVLYSKPTATRHFTIIDAGMNDLIRPTLYEAYHDVWPVRERAGATPLLHQDLVGPVCESGDYLAQNQALPPLAEGELIAIMSAGAYGAVMSSTYNSRLLVPEVLVKGADFAVIRPRQTYEELISLDKIPSWLD